MIGINTIVVNCRRKIPSNQSKYPHTKVKTMRAYMMKNLSLFFVSSLLVFLVACTGAISSSTEQKTATWILVSPQPSSTPTVSARDIPATPTQQLEQPSPSPTPIITSTPALKKGTLEIKPIEIDPDKAKFDLDAREVTNVDDTRADIEYHRYEGKGRQAIVGFGIASINKTKFSSEGQSIKTYEDCLKAVSEFIDNYSVADVTYQYNNQAFCVLTNQNRLALLRFQQGDEKTVQFKYVISIDSIDVK